jgi:putative effector of murein hydrolase
MSNMYPIFLSLFFLFAIGIPVSFVTGDHRLLDGCMLWFVWITSCRVQRGLANMSDQSTSAIASQTKRVAMTLLNPVLLTTLMMTAYTRARSSATSIPLHDVLDAFSSGTSLSELWSNMVNPKTYPLKPQHAAYFGAGDAALAVLEVGIVVWGFKLHECRLQLASRAGLSVVLVSGAAAALNVFVSTLLGKGFGLAAPASLAFAARSTTLALARPAVSALGGNEVVNAALVVSNGILGQLLYPFVLARLGLDQCQAEPSAEDESMQDEDDSRVVATGTTIGINGAAMGVAYLYECKNRAAPYAVLSMTVFGVMTVVFSAVEPFTATLQALAAL